VSPKASTTEAVSSKELAEFVASARTIMMNRGTLQFGHDEAVLTLNRSHTPEELLSRINVLIKKHVITGVPRDELEAIKAEIWLRLGKRR
jgi:hypothetical protein